MARRAIRMDTSKIKGICLVTGGTSGIGIELIKNLISMGYEVRALLRSHPEEYQNWKRLPAGVKPYVADLTFKSKEDERGLEAACKDVDCVFHMASATYNSRYNYNQMIDTNVIGTENLLNSIIKANEGTSKEVHVLFTSTTTVYGSRRPGDVLTELSDEMPASHYAESKLMAEHLIESFAESHKEIFYTIFRMGRIYGHEYEMPYYFKAFRMVQEQKMRYIGKGTNHLSVINVKDAADAMIMAMQKPKAASNQIFNLTDGVPHTPRELFGLVAKTLGVEPPTKSVNSTVARLLLKAADMDYDEYEFLSCDRTVSIAKIKEKLGWMPSRRIDIDGLLMVEDYMRSTRRAKIRA